MSMAGFEKMPTLSGGATSDYREQRRRTTTRVRHTSTKVALIYLGAAFVQIASEPHSGLMPDRVF
jgi:hypothetical protein